jgi:hypothetical protein
MRMAAMVASRKLARRRSAFRCRTVFLPANQATGEARAVGQL